MNATDKVSTGYRNTVTEFSLNGHWKFIKYWSFPAYSKLASVNGQLCIVYDNGSYAPIAVYGENYGSCACCGYMPLCNHYLLRDVDTGRELNVGSECLPKILGAVLGEHIKSAVESIKRKVSAEFRRPIKNEQLKTYVLQVYDVEKAKDKRKARILKAVEDNKELYWTPKYYFKWDEKTGKSEPDLNNPKSEEERSKYALDSMNKDINFWANMREHYKPIGEFRDSWNPDTMIREMKKESTKDGLSIPKWRKLTLQEQEQEDNLIMNAVNEFILRAEKRRSY